MGQMKFEADKDDCPWHGLKGNYDFNRIRVVEKKKWWKIGFATLER